jgi:hypothetical protein
MRRHIFTLLFFSIFLNCFSQTDSVNSLPCANRRFAILAHVFLNQNLDTGITKAQIESFVSKLNTAWEPICISFYLCEMRVHGNYNFSIWDDDRNKQEAIAIYGEKSVINVYMMDSMGVPPAGGYATLAGISSTSDPFVAIKKSLGAGVWIHEFGHYFGLEHTHETSHGAELVDGSNCTTAGDGICDTPADPFPNGSSANCKFVSAAIDANGDKYLPLVENYMSYWDCACRFTRGQYLKMYNTYSSAPKAHW